MKKILLLLMLFHNMSSILATCPDSPTSFGGTTLCTSQKNIPTTSLTNFPSSDFYDLSIGFTVQLIDVANSCFASQKNYLTVAIGTSSVATIYYDSGALKVRSLGTTFTVSGMTISSMTKWVSVFFSLKLSNDALDSPLKIDAVTDSSFGTLESTPGSSRHTTLAYNPSTTIYLCSEYSGTSVINANTCLFSRLKIFYSTPSGSVQGFSGNLAPTLAAFYPLDDGSSGTSLRNTWKPTSPGYLGNAASGATSTTLPTWDSTNKVFSITSDTQFLTFPMPNLQAGESSTSLSFTISAWINVKSSIAAESTIFNIVSSDGTTSKLKLTVTTSGTLKIIGVSSPINLDSSVTISFDTWHLVDLTVFAPTNSNWIVGSVSVDTSFTGFSTQYSAVASSTFVSGDVLHVGDSASSFIGDVSIVRIMTPGAAYIRGGTDVCSSAASVELGSEGFALACSGTNALSHNACYASTSCPSGSTLATGGASQNLCLGSNTGNTGGTNGGTTGSNTEVTESSSDDLSGGAIVGIVIGSIAGVVLVGGAALYWSGRRKKSSRYSRKPPSVPEAATVITTSP